ncbi:cupin domain-containing protein [Dongia rigui]|uniref:Cupin domain-containing protein n=1 Tax=Dongia rigui TaxID=940149 RepID=A0ABU5DZH0_9PROT|nr:cupin domain-containing protein [Dongia rigui]MDY0872729.1 cupin domain-containing protein [Dongia rigui]
MPEGIDKLVTRLNLAPHPEGGFYRETYRAGETIPNAGLPARFHGPRSLATAIYYLLRAGERSKLHRIKSDEVWHFYEGDALTIIAISADGQLIETTLGREFSRGQVPQHVVPAGYWFGALPAKVSAFTLAGCTVAPGFDFADFELADRGKLLSAFPQHKAWIERLTD